MTASVKGRLNWTVTRDSEGHREYMLTTLIECTSSSDGPESVLSASGLPTVGSYWAYGNDSDPWALCWPDAVATPVIEDEPNYYWRVEQKFSTRPLLEPPEGGDQQDPLIKPQRVSGSFIKYMKEGRVDRNGNDIDASNGEAIRGLMFDASKATVVVEQNVANLQLSTITGMMNTVNDAPLWGLAARKIKLSTMSWSRHMYNVGTYYYTRRFEFEIDFDGFDRSDVWDAGTKVAMGVWTDTDGDGHKDTWTQIVATPSTNEEDFETARDQEGNIQGTVYLDGIGGRLTNLSNKVKVPTIEYYDQSNFLLLGIPTVL